MRKKVVLTIVLLLLFNIAVPAKTNDNSVTIIYFYSSTCSTCQKLSSFLKDMQQKNTNIKLIKYNILNLINKSLMDKYTKIYMVKEDDIGIVPVIFVKKTYLIGEKSIKEKLENLIRKSDGIKTIEIYSNTENHDMDIKQFRSFKTFSVFLAGLINGINPCSMSMLLFFLSLVATKRINILKIGITFCIGKFLAYLMLGTIFFNILSKLDIEWFHGVVKVLMLLMILILILLNLNDFFAAKEEKYNRIKVQLPKFFRKLNHNIIENILNVANIKFLLLISFFLGIIISLGEFLCTGQIYLTTIITILQTSNIMSLHAFTYLVLYDTAFIIPLLILTYTIHKGKEVFDISEVIRERLHLIKLINTGIFIVFGIIVLILF